MKGREQAKSLPSAGDKVEYPGKSSQEKYLKKSLVEIDKVP